MIRRVLCSLIILFSIYSCNPFAPQIDESLGTAGGLISDRSSVDGVFRNLKNAYYFKDTLIYGQLLNKNFTFSYRDYDKGIDDSWGRDEEMRITHGLFQNSQLLDLNWNNIVSLTTDSTRIIRSFNLTVTFNPTDIILVDGKVNLTLAKDEDNKWKITRWVDESNF